MINLNNFKTIADDLMNDIYVTEKMKRDTMARCKAPKRTIPVYKYLVPAACMLLVLSVLRFTTMLGDRVGPDQGNVSDTRILLASPEAVQDSSLSNSWVVSMEEAKDTFGKVFLTPSYIPDEFTVKEILATGPDKDSVESIKISYISGVKEIQIIEGKAGMPAELQDCEEIRINGVVGYIKTTEASDSENGEVRTVLSWYTDGVNYIISGSLSKQEAIKMANSMK